MASKNSYAELVDLVRTLYEEVRRHQADYHYRTPGEVLERVREFLAAADRVQPGEDGEG